MDANQLISMLQELTDVERRLEVVVSVGNYQATPVERVDVIRVTTGRLAVCLRP